ncbi:uncharacterized protein LOC121872564 [Homarus americanus]|uniref:ER-bound oxygenase mpaB/mpaB'/Rubber oxygenase catalytic domain-containing protein n=1 Tax=Homarus americanus TaxID=6706 RepID=A0A8J5MTY5_HOMAM|nr:uncharacterized protein LOC121872564 [Homarus americanus]XP_042231310.1 uncharacterized protein LOC121872564 [Homarus americanus]XP_042231311.1 uncharacterized protein LOC121872564 [Homarus americanus]XP_042231313.1 uncharacterized protein LOC121872564 [Homarus americanus]KAG7163506.1 hypothetical protein Hamer_G002697 [Homarus americanus]
MTLLCSAEGRSGEALLQCPVMGQTLLAPGVALRTRHTHTHLTPNGDIPNGVIKPHDEADRNNRMDHKNIKQVTRLRSIGTSEGRASPRLKELLEGLNEPGDSGNLPEAPEWLDRELFNRGRQFYQRYLFCIFFSDLLSLLVMFSISRILRPLIYTERSDTPRRALRRYVSTIMHVITWFSGDVWDPLDHAHKDIMTVRSTHKNSAQIFNSSTHYEEVETMDVKKKKHEEPRCPIYPAICQDLQPQVRAGLVLESPDNSPVYISQWDMLITQYSFLGMMVAHPCRMGAWWVTENELAGLIHFWRGIGWLLGIEDKYNFCNGTVKETKALCHEIEQLVVKPRLSEVGWSHEHMASSLIDGMNYMVPGLSYPAMFRFLADSLDLAVPTFISHMSTFHTCQYWVLRFVFHVLFLVPGVVLLFNQLLKTAIRFIQNQNPSWFFKSHHPHFRGHSS